MKENAQFNLSNADETPNYDRRNIYSRDVLLSDMLFEKEEEPEEESFDNDHFDKIIVGFFNDSITNIRELEKLLNSFGAKPYIEKEKMLFFITSFLYLQFFQEANLRNKYCPQYEDEVLIVLNELIFRIADRVDSTPEKIGDLYLKGREAFEVLAEDKSANMGSLYYDIAISYVQVVFLGKAPENAEIFKDTALFAIAEFFFKAMDNGFKYLSNLANKKEEKPPVKKPEKTAQTATREKELEYLMNRKNEIQAQITEKEEKVERKQAKHFIYVIGIYTAIFYIVAVCLGWAKTDSNYAITKAVFVCMLIGLVFAMISLVLSNTLFYKDAKEFIEIEDLKEELQETNVLIEDIQKTERKIRAKSPYSK